MYEYVRCTSESDGFAAVVFVVVVLPILPPASGFPRLPVGTVFPPRVDGALAAAGASVELSPPPLVLLVEDAPGTVLRAPLRGGIVRS